MSHNFAFESMPVSNRPPWAEPNIPYDSHRERRWKDSRVASTAVGIQRRFGRICHRVLKRGWSRAAETHESDRWAIAEWNAGGICLHPIESFWAEIGAGLFVASRSPKIKCLRG